MGNIISAPLPHDLPENWTKDMYVTPGGTEVGLSQQHGYNYLMQQVNASQVAAGQLDDALSIVPNTNFLHNWYFPDVVDKKNSYIVEAGTQYYTTSATNVVGGTIAKDTAVKSVQMYYVEVTLPDSTIGYVRIANARQGYLLDKGTAFHFSRWWGTQCKAVRSRTGVTVSAIHATYDANYRQAVANPWRFAGRTVTFSVLCKDLVGNCELTLVKSTMMNTATLTFSTTTLVEGMNTVTLTLPEDVGSTTYPFLLLNIKLPAGARMTLVAVKMELGNRQTLAYRTGESWALTDIPDSVVELLRCNGAPTDIGGEGAIVTAKDLGLTTANTLAEVEVVE